jgi:hypothetical protein
MCTLCIFGRVCVCGDGNVCTGTCCNVWLGSLLLLLPLFTGAVYWLRSIDFYLESCVLSPNGHVFYSPAANGPAGSVLALNGTNGALLWTAPVTGYFAYNLIHTADVLYGVSVSIVRIVCWAIWESLARSVCVC